MFPAPNPRRVKTGLDSAEYNMRQFKSGTQIDGKSLRLGRELWVKGYGSGFLWNVKLLTLVHGHDARC